MLGVRSGTDGAGRGGCVWPHRLGWLLVLLLFTRGLRNTLIRRCCLRTHDPQNVSMLAVRVMNSNGHGCSTVTRLGRAHRAPRRANFPIPNGVQPMYQQREIAPKPNTAKPSPSLGKFSCTYLHRRNRGEQRRPLFPASYPLRGQRGTGDGSLET